jgi:hypothetical protein
MVSGRNRGRTGSATSSVEYSPERLRRMSAAMARTETRWARMAGPVTVRRLPNERVASEPAGGYSEGRHLAR